MEEASSEQGRTGRADDRADRGRQREVLRRPGRRRRRRRLRLLDGARLRDRAGRLGLVRPHRRRDVPQEDRGRHHQPGRRHVGSDLGDRRSCGRARPPAARPSSTATTSSRCSARPSRASRSAGNSDLGDKTLLDALRAGRRRVRDGARRGRRRRRRRCRGPRWRLASRPRPRGRCSPSAAAPRTRASAASARSTRGPSPSRSCSNRSPTRGRPTSRRRGRGMKKFVNDPKDFVPEMLKGIALANPDTLKYVPEYNLIMRTDAPSDDEGLDRPGLGFRPRARARDDRRQGHARRRVSGRRVRGAADGLRPGDDQAAQLQEGRAAPDQQLHRRPDGVRDGRARWPRPRASRSGP